MILEISDRILKEAQLNEKTFRIEIALLLFQKYQLSFGQARKLAGLNVIDFQKILAANKIPLHYDLEDFDKDLQKSLR